MTSQVLRLSEDKYLCDGCLEKRQLITRKTRRGYLCKSCYDSYMEDVMDD